jgi:predicted nucleic acid-binding protein
MVGFDAHFVMLAFRPAIPTSADCPKERVRKLLDDLQQAGERILIPTPALTEFLVHAENAGSKYLEEIQKSSRFRIAGYNVRAAVEVASIIKAAVTRREKRDGTRDTWAKVNFDRQIVGIAKAEGCHILYSDDPSVKKFAAKIGLKVRTLAECNLPQSPHPLFDGVLDEEESTTTGTSKNSAGLPADGTGSTGNEASTTKEKGTKKPKPAEIGGLT